MHNIMGTPPGTFRQLWDNVRHLQLCTLSMSLQLYKLVLYTLTPGDRLLKLCTLARPLQLYALYLNFMVEHTCQAFTVVHTVHVSLVVHTYTRCTLSRLLQLCTL